MIIRFGYVSIALNLGEKGKTSGKVSYKRYSNIVNDQEKIDVLKSVTLRNLDNLENVLKYNIENQIHFYRITSSLFPLVTHPDVGYWGHRELFKHNYNVIGSMLKENKMRVDTHPDHFNVINSTNSNVVRNTEINLMHQASFFEDIDYDDGMMVIHVGGATGGKEQGIERFAKNIKRFPSEIKNRIMIENDDKVYNASDVLSLCSMTNSPMVLDIHHFNCNNDEENLDDIIVKCFDTYEGKRVIPKIHFSSPKNGGVDRRHSDYINPYDFISFIERTKALELKSMKEFIFDVMLEAKMKDKAVFKLIDDIKSLRHDFLWEDKTTLRI